MKYLLIGLLIFGQVSAFAQNEYNCIGKTDSFSLSIKSKSISYKQKVKSGSSNYEWLGNSSKPHNNRGSCLNNYHCYSLTLSAKSKKSSGAIPKNLKFYNVLIPSEMLNKGSSDEVILEQDSQKSGLYGATIYACSISDI